MALFTRKEQKLERERDARLVRELFEKHEDLPTHAARQQRFEKAEKWFEEKHHCDWRFYCGEPEKGR